MTNPLQRYLGSGDTLERLHDHAQKLMRLQSLFVQFLPTSLQGQCAVANIKGETITVIANNGAVATRLKQLGPSLITQFSQSGVAFAQLKVKVQIQIDPKQPAAPRPRLLSSDAKRNLEQLAATLPAGDPLRESLERLARRSRER